jgi:hypothetical protein
MNTANTIYALQCAGIDTSQMTGTSKKANDTNCDDVPAKSYDPVQHFTKDGKSFTKEDLRHVSKLRREGSNVPLSLRHVLLENIEDFKTGPSG